MKTKSLIIALSLSVGLLTGCTEKKETKKETETEITTEKIKTTPKDTINEAEKRRLDSIKQVKEHGHAH